MATLGLNATNYHVGLKRAEGAAQAFSNSVRRKFAAAFGVAALTAFTVKIVNAADELLDMSERLGMNTEKLQEWIFAAKKGGATANTLTTFFESMAMAREKALGGDTDTLNAFNKLGINDMMLARNNPDEMGRQIGAAFESGNVKDLLPSLRKIGGKGAGELIPAFRSGIDEASEAAKKAGQVLDTSILLKLKQIKKEFLDINDLASSDFGKGLARWVTPAAMMVKDLFKLNREVMVNLGAGKGISTSVSDAISQVKKERAETMQALFEQRKIMLGLTDSAAPSRASLLNRQSPKGNAFAADRLIDVFKTQGLRAMMPDGGNPQLNEWQRLGAATRGGAEQRLQLVAENTRKTVERLEALIRLNKGQFGAGQTF
jgi:hypothetical protein